RSARVAAQAPRSSRDRQRLVGRRRRARLPRQAVARRRRLARDFGIQRPGRVASIAVDGDRSAARRRVDIRQEGARSSSRATRMTIESWLQAAVADAERRGLPELKAMLEALAKATAILRQAPLSR